VGNTRVAGRDENRSQAILGAFGGHGTVTAAARPCRICRRGVLLPETRRRWFLGDDGKRRYVRLHASRCSACGYMTTLASQHKANLETLNEAMNKKPPGGGPCARSRGLIDDV